MRLLAPILAAVLCGPPAWAAEGEGITRRQAALIGVPVLAGTAILANNDEELQNKLQDFKGSQFARSFGLHHLGNDRTLFEIAGGGAGMAALAVSFYAGGALARSERARRVGVLIPAAFLVNGVLVQGVKRVAGRERPSIRRDRSAEHWKIFGSGQSFYSGHTSSAFAMAAVVADHYDSFWIDAASYGAAAMVGFGRCLQNHHWTSDVLFGAGMGVLAGKFTVGVERDRKWLIGLYADGRGLFAARRF